MKFIIKKDKDFYYDGPVKDSGRSLEEIELDIEKEKDRMEKQGWPTTYHGE
jgi:hypothetical protein